VGFGGAADSLRRFVPFCPRPPFQVRHNRGDPRSWHGDPRQPTCRPRHGRIKRSGDSRSVARAESASNGSGPCSARFVSAFGLSTILRPAECVCTTYNKPRPRAGTKFRFGCLLESDELAEISLRREPARLEFHLRVRCALVAIVRKARTDVSVLRQGHTYAVGFGDAAG
jgi:hypothetical protein